MANSLLDFVLALVRDPDAAARYAANPDQAIADAHLTDVTSIDVQNLLPVVSESLSMSVPSFGVDALAGEPAGNVWASGAATAAFDSFDDQAPDPGHSLVLDAEPSVPDVVADLGPGFDAFASSDLADPALSLQVDDALGDELPVTDAGLVDDWAQPVVDQHPGDHAPAFDLFD